MLPDRSGLGMRIAFASQVVRITAQSAHAVNVRPDQGFPVPVMPHVRLSARAQFRAADAHQLCSASLGPPALTRPAQLTACVPDLSGDRAGRDPSLKRDVTPTVLHTGFRIRASGDTAGWRIACLCCLAAFSTDHPPADCHQNRSRSP